MSLRGEGRRARTPAESRRQGMAVPHNAPECRLARGRDRSGNAAELGNARAATRVSPRHKTHGFSAWEEEHRRHSIARNGLRSRAGLRRGNGQDGWVNASPAVDYQSAVLLLLAFACSSGTIRGILGIGERSAETGGQGVLRVGDLRRRRLKPPLQAEARATKPLYSLVRRRQRASRILLKPSSRPSG